MTPKPTDPFVIEVYKRNGDTVPFAMLQAPHQIARKLYDEDPLIRLFARRLVRAPVITTSKAEFRKALEREGAERATPARRKAVADALAAAEEPLDSSELRTRAAAILKRRIGGHGSYGHGNQIAAILEDLGATTVRKPSKWSRGADRDHFIHPDNAALAAEWEEGAGGDRE